MTAASV